MGLLAHQDTETRGQWDSWTREHGAMWGSSAASRHSPSCVLLGAAPPSLTPFPGEFRHQPQPQSQSSPCPGPGPGLILISSQS